MVHTQMIVQFLWPIEVKITNAALFSQCLTSKSKVHQSVPVAVPHYLQEVCTIRLGLQQLSETLVKAQNALLFFLSEECIQVHPWVTWSGLTALAIKVNLKLTPGTKCLVTESALWKTPNRAGHGMTKASSKLSTSMYSGLMSSEVWQGRCNMRA